ncbi:MAG: hypothetical protein R3B47_10740 [Bacteroidia bacterium]
MIYRYIIACLAVMLVMAGLMAQNYVERNGNKFRYQGADYRFVGLNIHNMAYTEYPAGQEDAMVREQLCMAKNMGARVIRIFAADKFTHHSQDIQTKVIDKINRVFNIAGEEGLSDLKFILCLTDYFNDKGNGRTPFYDDYGCYSSCGNKGCLSEYWFERGNVNNGWNPEYNSSVINNTFYTGNDKYPGPGTPPPDLPCDNNGDEGGYMANFIPFLDALATQYKNHQQVFAWELGNELKVTSNNTDEMLEFLYFAGWRLKSHNNVSQMVTTGFESVFKAMGDYGIGNVPVASDYYPGDPELNQHTSSYNQLKSLIGKVYKEWRPLNYTHPSPFDFITIHAYAQNNGTHWDHVTGGSSSGGQGVQADALWAMENNMPFIVEEGLFEVSTNGNSNDGYGGATWRLFHRVPSSIPAGASNYNEIAIPNTNFRRCNAMSTILSQFFVNLGCDGYMQWGFYGLDNTGLGQSGHDSRLGLTKNHEDWSTLYTQLYNQANQLKATNTWVECVEDEMIITNWPSSSSTFVNCTSGDYIKMSTPVNNNQQSIIAASKYVHITNFSTRSNSRFRASSCQQICKNCSGNNRRDAFTVPPGEGNAQEEQVMLKAYPNPLQVVPPLSFHWRSLLIVSWPYSTPWA